MGFARRDYWRGLLCLHAGDLPNRGIKSASLMSPASCGFRVTALVFCKRIATKSGFLPLWVLSHLLNEIGSWPVVMGLASREHDRGVRARAGRVWEFEKLFLWTLPFQLCDVTWPGHDSYHAAPTYWLPGHPSHLLPPWSLEQWVLWYCQLQVIHGHFCQQSLLNSPQII